VGVFAKTFSSEWPSLGHALHVPEQSFAFRTHRQKKKINDHLKIHF
jgi:hypothetical protein